MIKDGNKIKKQDVEIPQQMLPRGLKGWFIGMIMPLFHRAIYKEVFPFLDLKPDDCLLEVGCGSGYFLKKYSSKAKSIAGLDLSEVMIGIAIKKNKKRIADGTAEFKLGDAAELPWEEGNFSIVTSMGSFIGFPDQQKSLMEMYRVLCPKGRVVISVEHNAEDGVDYSDMAEKYGIEILSQRDVRSMLEKAGFSKISFSYFRTKGMPGMMIARAVKP